MAKILGISAYFHDSSAALLVDGKIIAAICEERLTRVKHDASFPEQSITACLEIAGISMEELDEVVFFEKPFTKFERILDMSVRAAPAGFIPFQKAIRSWLKSKIWIQETIRKKLGWKGQITFCQHHMAHAALAAYSGPYKDAALVVMDGVGERACTTVGIFETNKIQFIREQRFPDSIGLFYSAFTYYCGFKVNGGEYKLMGLAPYGQPVYAEMIRKHLVEQQIDGSIRLNLNYFNFHKDTRMIHKRMENLLGFPVRKPEAPLTDEYKNLAASVQLVTEELVLELLRSVYELTGKKQVLLSGGVALNCVINERIIGQTGFDSFWVPSAAGDSGCALGAALWRHGSSIFTERNLADIDYLGPEFLESDYRNALDRGQLIGNCHSEEELMERTADFLSQGKVVGWFQGRMEFGPRALGNRSILAFPGIEQMQQTLNLKIKKREGFRPFAPIVPIEALATFFEQQEGVDYSRMTTVAKARKPESVKACVHVDGTARVQALEEKDNPKLYRLLKRMEEKSGIPVLINTSFNERGEPMVCTPEDAISCFFNTEMDILVLGNFLVEKTANTHIPWKTKQYEAD